METISVDETMATSRIEKLVKRVNLEEDLHEAALLAVDWYDSDLPYHNLGHMIEVAETTVRLCEERKVPTYLTQILLLAALWHDADYRSPLEAEFISKEHRSAELAHQAIMFTGAALNAEERLMIADRVATLIISTKEDYVPTDIAEEILNEADLGNLTGDRIEMLRRSGAYFIEGLLLDGQAVMGTTEEVLIEHIGELITWCPTAIERLNHIAEAKFGKKVLDFASEASDVASRIKTNLVAITPTRILDAAGKN